MKWKNKNAIQSIVLCLPCRKPAITVQDFMVTFIHIFILILTITLLLECLGNRLKGHILCYCGRDVYTEFNHHRSKANFE
jgi:hypothetical protein